MRFNRLLAACVIGACLVGVLGCAKQPSPKLLQGVAVMRYFTSIKYLKRSMFFAAYPEGKPSQFISYIFSDVGAAEWPDSDEMAERDPMIREQARAIRVPLIPSGVLFFPYKPDPAKAQMQVVIKPDDATNEVIIEAYELPSQPPVRLEKQKLPLLKASPEAQASYGSLIEMGAYPGSQ